MNVDLRQGDCFEVLKELPENSVDAVVTDPPYGLGFMGKRWDKGVPSKEIWLEVFRVMKHGSHLLSFGGTRTYHRMATAIEDAGFEIRDMLSWLYGSGFPKSYNIGKALDKKLGNKREIIGRNPNSRENCDKSNTIFESGTVGKTDIISKGNSKFEGWGSGLKPACEPVVLARKPLSEKSIVENVLKWGVGGLNIDASRINYVSDKDRSGWHKSGADGSKGFQGENTFRIRPISAEEIQSRTSLGRFPANVLLDEEAGRLLDEQAPLTGAFAPVKSGQKAWGGKIYHKFNTSGDDGKTFYDNKLKGASRFFYVAKASRSEREEGLNQFNGLEIVLKDVTNNKLIWKEKITTQEVREAKRLVDMEILVKKVIEEYGIKNKNGLDLNIILFGKTILEKYQKDINCTTKTETNLIMCRQILNLLRHYTTQESTQDVFSKMMVGGNHVVNVENSNTLKIIINEQMGFRLGVNPVVLEMQFSIKENERVNEHPTIKPIKLMEYLVKLVTPVGGLVLDPFMGSGTTGIACVKNDFRFIGIEKEKEYLEIARARINNVRKQSKMECEK